MVYLLLPFILYVAVEMSSPGWAWTCPEGKTIARRPMPDPSARKGTPSRAAETAQSLAPSSSRLDRRAVARQWMTFMGAMAVGVTLPWSIGMTSADQRPSQLHLDRATAQAKDLKEEYRQGTAALSGQDEDGPLPREAYQKLPSGVIYADVRPGTGSVKAQTGSRLNLQWVLRKSNGYFVDSSEKQEGVPFIFTVGDGTAIAGLDEAVRGMKLGGVRRILIPPSLAYVQGLEDGLPGPLPAGYGPRQQIRRVQGIRKDVPGEYLYLEVQLTRLR